MSSTVLRPLAATSLMAAVVLTAAASPAQAQRAEVNPKACASEGGVFTRAGGVKTCTTTEVITSTGPAVSASVTLTEPVCTFHRSCSGLGTLDYTYTGTSQRTTTVEITTVRTQRGHRRVSTSVSEQTLASTVEQLGCTVTPDRHPTKGPLMLEDCHSKDLFTA